MYSNSFLVFLFCSILFSVPLIWIIRGALHYYWEYALIWLRISMLLITSLSKPIHGCCEKKKKSIQRIDVFFCRKSSEKSGNSFITKYLLFVFNFKSRVRAFFFSIFKFFSLLLNSDYEYHSCVSDHFCFTLFDLIHFRIYFSSVDSILFRSTFCHWSSFRSLLCRCIHAMFVKCGKWYWGKKGEWLRWWRRLKEITNIEICKQSDSLEQLKKWRIKKKNKKNREKSKFFLQLLFFLFFINVRAFR